MAASIIRHGLSFLYLFDDVDNFIVVVFQCHVRPFRMAVSVLPFSCRLCVYFRRAVDMLALRVCFGAIFGAAQFLMSHLAWRCAYPSSGSLEPGKIWRQSSCHRPLLSDIYHGGLNASCTECSRFRSFAALCYPQFVFKLFLPCAVGRVWCIIFSAAL